MSWPLAPCDGWGDIRLYEWITAGIQAIGVVVVAWYTLVTWRQLKTLRTSNDTNRLALEETKSANLLARDALVLAHRAWLNVGISGCTPNASGGAGYAYITIANVGKMPARAISYTALLSLQPGYEITEDLELIRSMFPLPVAPLGIGQNQQFTIEVDRETAIKTQGRERRILHIIASVTYDDGFGNWQGMTLGWHSRRGVLQDPWNFTPGFNAIDGQVVGGTAPPPHAPPPAGRPH